MEAVEGQGWRRREGQKPGHRNGQCPSQDKLFALGRVGHEALSPPHGLSQSHICSPKGLYPNDYQQGWGKGRGVKTPGEKPFALEMWGCVIVSTAAIRGRRRQQEVTQHACKNRTSVGSVIRCAPGLAALPLPSKPKQGKAKPQRWGGRATPVCGENTQKALPAPAREAQPEMGTDAGCTSSP